ncbi:RNase H domain-containing protein [Trichonephila clavipes]|nr:RNase H domain-containing protein [Trichonephila clavipes]
MSVPPELLKQLTLEVINGIPLNAHKLCTDGSKEETNTTGSRVLIELPGYVIKIQRRNADHASVFRTELIAIMAKELICKPWVVPPVHPWYFQRHPGFAISFKGSRTYQTAFSQLATDHLSCITPIVSFNHVEFREELLTSTPKHSSHPELLRQLALEVINDIRDQALIIYTDGSRLDTGREGSGIFSNTPGNDVKISIRNLDHCSIFRSELIAISGALDHALSSYKDNIWIRTDSRSSIQYLKNWPNILDSTGLDILSKLVRLGERKQVCLQWIPSHVGVPGNEAADELASRGFDLPNPSFTVLTHTEIHSFQRNKMNLTWRNSPAYHWYAAKSPGLSIQCRSSRAHQTALARLRSGHLRSMTFVQGVKSFFTCPCSLLASPTHLLDCWGISLRQFYEEQGLVFETITRKGQMDLV